MARDDSIDPDAVAALIRRIFPGSDSRFARAESGVSTPVYRVWHSDELFYLRLSETREASLLPEMQVHTYLHRQGARVPEVVFFEPFDDAVERSAMLTTEIRGEPLGEHPVDATMPTILREAGRDLALINNVPVEGFGWIRRDRPDAIGLEAEHPTFQDFVCEHLDEDLSMLATRVLTVAETATVRTLIDQAISLHPGGQSWLAHGDFDVTHIFQEQGRYTGIIDFGEIRGAGRLYDLGHFLLHDGERLHRSALRFLLDGYREITPLPPEEEWQIKVTGLMIGIRALARAMPRPAGEYQRFLSRAIRALLRSLVPCSISTYRSGK